MNEVSEKLIRELAEKFGTTAEHLWKVMIHQAHMEGLLGLAAAALCFGAVGACVWGAWWFKKQSDDAEAFAILCVGVILVTTIFAPLGWIQFAGAIAALLNPEYWALSQLIN